MRVGERRSSEASARGATLVEFALVAPLLFALLAGLITFGMSLSRKNSMTNASREGARLGATLVADGSWAASVRGRVVELAGGDLEADQVCVRLVYRADADDTAGTTVQASSCSLPGASEPNLPEGTAVGDCVAKVWSRRPSDIDTIFFSRTITLTASAVAHYERGSGSECN